MATACDLVQRNNGAEVQGVLSYNMEEVFLGLFLFKLLYGACTKEGIRSAAFLSFLTSVRQFIKQVQMEEGTKVLVNWESLT